MTKPQPGDLIQSHPGLPDRLVGNRNRSYIVKCNMTIPDQHIPPIPYRDPNTHRLFFPSGKWTAWLTDVDFEILIREGFKINMIFESKEFDVFNDLGEYALSIYKKRKATDDHFMKILYKYLMNAVYGKLAERSEKKRMLIHPSRETLERLDFKYAQYDDDDNLLIGGLEQCYVRDGVFIEDIYLPLQHVHVPISARITALSRELIYDLLTDSSNAYYCDTDGFATDDDFPTGNELGELKMEKEIIYGEFHSPKVYSLRVNKEGKEETIVHAKGFSLGKQDTPEKRAEAIKRFRAIVEGKHIQVERMSRLRENLRKNAAPKEVVVKKALSDNVIPKRFFYPDGESRPWSVEEIKGFPK